MLASIYYKLAKSSKRFQHFNMNISTFSGSSVSFWGNKKKTPHVSHRKSTLNRNLFYNETLWKSCRQNTKNVSNIKLIKTVYSYKSKLKKQVLLFLKSVDIYKHKSQLKIINQSKDRKNEKHRRVGMSRLASSRNVQWSKDGGTKWVYSWVKGPKTE